MEQNMLRGVITALATPMLPNGEIDFDSVTKLVELQLKNKVDGIVVAGSTGEGSMLTYDEKVRLLQHVIKINRGLAKIIMAFNDIATNFALDLINKLNTIDGIDYYLATAPAYVRPTQEGLYQHFRAISIASRHPIILYNVPGRTGCDLDNKTVIRLATDFSNIVGLKDATGDLSRADELFQKKNKDFAIYSGDDGSAVDFILKGGDGVISVASNLVPEHFRAMISDALSGNKLAAFEVNNQLLGLYEALSFESNPVALKWALFFKKIIKHDVVRLPLLPLSSAAQEKMKPVLMDI